MGITKWLRTDGRQRRHLRVRKKIAGTAQKPRLSVYRSLNHMYAQLIDDDAGKTLVEVSTAAKVLKAKVKSGGNVAAAAVAGEALAERALAMGVTKVVFDRGGYQYHGRVKALAEAARKKGLIF